MYECMSVCVCVHTCVMPISFAIFVLFCVLNKAAGKLPDELINAFYYR